MYGIGAGSFAEYAVAHETKLARKPANVTFEQAAVVPVSGLTALQALRDVARVQPGQRVLVTGASGGVGSYAVQIAKALGAEVTGVCSTAKLDLVSSLGADHVIDYTQEHFADRAERYDVIIDINGSTGVLSPRGAPSPRAAPPPSSAARTAAPGPAGSSAVRSAPLLAVTRHARAARPGDGQGDGRRPRAAHRR